MLRNKMAFSPLTMCILNQLSFYRFDLFTYLQAALHGPAVLTLIMEKKKKKGNVDLHMKLV